MEGFVALIIIIFAILQIILFFKLWQMTNDTAKIKRMLDFKNKLSFMNKVPKKCKDSNNNIYYIRSIDEDCLYCSKTENGKELWRLEIKNVVFLYD